MALAKIWTTTIGKQKFVLPVAQHSYNGTSEVQHNPVTLIRQSWNNESYRYRALLFVHALNILSNAPSRYAEVPTPQRCVITNRDSQMEQTMTHNMNNKMNEISPLFFLIGVLWNLLCCTSDPNRVSNCSSIDFCFLPRFLNLTSEANILLC